MDFIFLQFESDFRDWNKGASLILIPFANKMQCKNPNGRYHTYAISGFC